MQSTDAARHPSMHPSHVSRGICWSERRYCFAVAQTEHARRSELLLPLPLTLLLVVVRSRPQATGPAAAQLASSGYHTTGLSSLRRLGRWRAPRAVAPAMLSGAARHRSERLAMRFHGGEIDDEIEFTRLLDREFARLRFTPNPVEVPSSAPKQRREVCSIGTTQQPNIMPVRVCPDSEAAFPSVACVTETRAASVSARLLDGN
jgi:hypothetical protein